MVRCSMFDHMHLRCRAVFIVYSARGTKPEKMDEEKSRVFTTLCSTTSILCFYYFCFCGSGTLLRGCCCCCWLIAIPEITCIHFCFSFTSVDKISFTQSLFYPAYRTCFAHKSVKHLVVFSKFSHIKSLLSFCYSGARRCGRSCVVGASI